MVFNELLGDMQSHAEDLGDKKEVKYYKELQQDLGYAIAGEAFK